MISAACRRRVRSRVLPWLAASMLAAGPAGAVGFTPVSQLRALHSDTTDSTTGYTCLEGGVGPPLPGCPVDLGTTTASDVRTAPDFATFDETAATPGGTSTQASSLAPGALLATGDASANATASEIDDPSYVLVLRTVDPSTTNDFLVTVSLDAATGFRFEASGWVEHPDPAFPVSGTAVLDVALEGPTGPVATLHASFDPSCAVSPSFGVCRVEPPPVVMSGTLPAGTYTLDVHLEAGAAGSWLPSTGPLPGFSSGGYEVALRLDGEPSPASLPALGPAALTGLAALLGGAGAEALRRRRRSEGPTLAIQPDRGRSRILQPDSKGTHVRTHPGAR